MKKLNNTYYILRHGEAVSNVKNIYSSWPETFRNPLTVHGRMQIKKSLKKLKGKKVDIIVSSDLMRTKQTAALAGKATKVTVKFDKRLREIGFGDFNGKPTEELLYATFDKNVLDRFFKNGETYKQVEKRIFECFANLEKKYNGKTIIIVSHQAPLWLLENKVKGVSLKEAMQDQPKNKRIKRGELRELKV